MYGRFVRSACVGVGHFHGGHGCTHLWHAPPRPEPHGCRQPEAAHQRLRVRQGVPNAKPSNTIQSYSLIGSNPQAFIFCPRITFFSAWDCFDSLRHGQCTTTSTSSNVNKHQALIWCSVRNHNRVTEACLGTGVGGAEADQGAVCGHVHPVRLRLLRHHQRQAYLLYNA